MAKLEVSNLVKVISGRDSVSIPEWQRTSFYDKQNQSIYIPAVKSDVTSAARFKKYGQAINYQGHTYLPLEIIKRLHPDQDFSYLEEKVLESIEQAS